MTTDAAIASRCVLTSSIGAGSLTTLVDVCTQAVQQAKSRATGNTAKRAFRVHTLLTRAQQGVLALIHVCAGVSSEFVSMVTDTPEAARGVVTAGVGTTGTESALICVMAGSVESICLVSTVTHTAVPPHWLIHTQALPTDAWPCITYTADTGRLLCRGHQGFGCHGNTAFTGGGGGAFSGGCGSRSSGAGQSLSSNRLLWTRRRATVCYGLLSAVLRGVRRELWCPLVAWLLDDSLSEL